MQNIDLIKNISIDENGNVIDTITNKPMKLYRNNRYIRLNEKEISLKTVYKQLSNTNICIDDIENLNGEEWKQIDFNYFISNRGRVKSFVKWKSRILKQSENTNGYLRVELYGKKILIHKLVAKYFLDKPTEGQTEIHHIDLNSQNNNADNLIYLTKEQHKQIHKQIRRNQKKGVNTDYAKVLYTILRKYEC